MTPCAELLEPRRLLSVTVSGSTLLVAGSSGDDTFTFSVSAGMLAVSDNGTASSYSGISRITVDGGTGANTIRLLSDGVPELDVADAGTTELDYSATTVAITADVSNGASTVERGGVTDEFTGGEVTVRGGSGQDTFRYGTDPDDERDARLRLYGNGGNDTFVDNVFDPVGAFNVRADGGANNDTFYIDEYTNDVIVGGTGNDLLYLNNESFPNTLDLGGGADTVNMGGALSEVDATDFIGVDRFVDIVVPLIGPADGATYIVDQPGTITGNIGPDYFVFTTAEAVIDGSYNGNGGFNTADYSPLTEALVISRDGLDNDTIGGQAFSFSDSIDAVLGGSGNDVLVGSDQQETLIGGLGNDSIVGLGGDDVLTGSLGNDTIFGGGGNDTIEGSGGRDILLGDGGYDLVLGGANPDKVYGGSGIDTVSGGGGDDILVGDSGADLFEGGQGNDRLFAADGNIDTVRGGAGTDTAEVDDDDLIESLEIV